MQPDILYTAVAPSLAAESSPPTGQHGAACELAEVMHVTEWLSPEAGAGLAVAVHSLSRAQQQLGVRTRVAGLADHYLKATAGCPAAAPPMLAGNVVGPRSFGYVLNYQQMIRHFGEHTSLVHSHGLWMYPNLAACRWATAAKKPFVISLQGLLDPWALAWRGLKKRVASLLYAADNLKTAACIHALSHDEARSIRAYGLRNPVAILPNGVDIGEYSALPDKTALTRMHPELCGQQLILFLGRIHPKKGLLNLAAAWGRLAREFAGWHLLIAGSDTGAHQAEVERAMDSMGVADRVTFLGRVTGRDKLAVLGAADVFVLPSFSEGFSMAILEAMASRIPVLLTRQCNFPEAEAAGAAIQVSPTPESTGEGLRLLLEMSEQERKLMGRRGHQLVAENYTWDSIAKEMIAVYQWCLVGGELPRTVSLQ